MTYTQSQLRSKNAAEILKSAILNDSMPSIGISAGVFSSVAQDHEMIVVGQKPGRNGKCQFIIRNSWGRGCSYYLEPYASSCDASKGTFLMDEDTLRAKLQDILIIKNTKSKAPNTNVEKDNEPKPDKPEGEIRRPEKPRNNQSNSNQVVENRDSGTKGQTSEGSYRQRQTENTTNPTKPTNPTKTNVTRKNSNSNSKPISNRNINNNLDSTTQENTNDQAADTNTDSGSSGFFSGLGSIISGIWNFLASLFKY